MLVCLLDIVVVLAERKTDAVGDAAVRLAVDRVDVADLADLVHAGEADDPGLAGLGIHLDLSQVQDIGIGRMWDRQCRCWGRGGRVPEWRSVSYLPIIFRRDAFFDHLVIGAVGAVRLAHGIHQLLGGDDGGVAVHVVRAAGGRHAAVGAEFGVALDEPDAVGSHAQRFERFERHHQRADVAALTQFLPGVVLGDGVVGIEFQGDGGAVGGAFGDVEAAPGEADAAAQFGRILFLRFLDRPLIVGAHLLHDLFHRILPEGIAVDIGVAGAGDVAPAELEGIDAGLLRQHVHQRLAQGVGLGRTVAAVRHAEVVVGVGDAGEAGDVGNLVGEEGKANRLGHEVVAAPRVRAVIHAEIELGRRDLAVLVAGNPSVGVAGAALAGEVLVLLIGHGERDGHLRHHSRGCGKADVAGVG